MDKPKSTEETTQNSISTMQSEVQSATTLERKQLSRSAFTGDTINDSIIYCSRSCSTNETVEGEFLSSYLPFPETRPGGYWGSDPASTDGVTEPHDSIWHRENRRNWDLIKSCSSKQFALASSDAITHKVDASASGAYDWGGSGEYYEEGVEPLYKKFGEYLFKIPNNGNGYNILFSADASIGHCTTNKSPDKCDIVPWHSGSRFWTSIVYFLLPNKNSKRVLCWSPGHMLGASARVKSDKINQTKRAINITHSYTDLVSINDLFIQRLCRAQGIDYTARNMKLDGYSSFGWGMVGGIDRWDRVDALSTGTLAVPESRYKENFDFGEDPHPNKGQRVQIFGGNSSFIAFKDGLNDTKSLDNHFTE